MLAVVAEDLVILEGREGDVLRVHYHRMQVVVAQVHDVAPV